MQKKEVARAMLESWLEELEPEQAESEVSKEVVDQPGHSGASAKVKSKHPKKRADKEQAEANAQLQAIFKEKEAQLEALTRQSDEPAHHPLLRQRLPLPDDTKTRISQLLEVFDLVAGKDAAGVQEHSWADMIRQVGDYDTDVGLFENIKQKFEFRGFDARQVARTLKEAGPSSLYRQHH